MPKVVKKPSNTQRRSRRLKLKNATSKSTLGSIFKYGKIVSGNYYQSQTGKLFKRVVNGQFVSLNN